MSDPRPATHPTRNLWPPASWNPCWFRTDRSTSGVARDLSSVAPELTRLWLANPCAASQQLVRLQLAWLELLQESTDQAFELLHQMLTRTLEQLEPIAPASAPAKD